MPLDSQTLLIIVNIIVNTILCVLIFIHREDERMSQIYILNIAAIILWSAITVEYRLTIAPRDWVIDGGLFLVMLVVGGLLIRSVDSEAKQREKLRRLAEEFQKTNAQQKNLLHFVGHEVKGFLTKSSGALAALIEGDFGVLPETAKMFVQQALAESRHGVDSVTNILEASNLKRGTVIYTKAPFDLKALVAELIEKERPTADKKGLSISLDADEPSYEMVGDKKQIGDHVLRNLIDNALNYTPSGSIQVSLKKGAGVLVCSVKDSGIGICDEDKKRLFTEGGRGKDSQRINVHSTGYGLYIAKAIVEAHGGTIRAESEGAGKGSTFVVELPV